MLKRVPAGETEATIPASGLSDRYLLTSAWGPMRPTAAFAATIRLSACAFAATLLPSLLAAQAVAANTQLPAAPALATPTSAIPTSISATRVDAAPVIDGRDDDAIWANIP